MEEEGQGGDAIPVVDTRLYQREDAEYDQEQGSFRQEELVRCIVELLTCSM
jgi:hypothetical protein